jgi:hypothetical protein
MESSSSTAGRSEWMKSAFRMGRGQSGDRFRHAAEDFANPNANAADKASVRPAKAGGSRLGLLVGGFWKTIFFQKPLAGLLCRLPVRSGLALVGELIGTHDS